MKNNNKDIWANSIDEMHELETPLRKRSLFEKIKNWWFNTWNKFKCWLIKKLGGITPKEYAVQVIRTMHYRSQLKEIGNIIPLQSNFMLTPEMHDQLRETGELGFYLKKHFQDQLLEYTTFDISKEVTEEDFIVYTCKFKVSENAIKKD